MTRVGRTGVWGLSVALIVTLGLWLSTSSTHAILIQDESSAVEVGAGPVREPAWSFVGRSLHSGESVTVFGYFTALKGLDPAVLFVDGSQSEATARFTYAGEIALTGQTDRGDVTSISGDGGISIFYLDEAAGASWNDPASFAAGQQLAELDVELRETLHRQGPGAGVVIGDSSLSQAMAAEFTLDGETYRFGESGIALRMRTVGTITAAAAPPGYSVSLTGGAAVTERPWTPVQLGVTATPVAAGTAEANLCDGLQPWLNETQAALASAGDLAGPVQGTSTSGEFEGEQVRAAAEQVATLASAQRAAPAPAGAEEAGRLAVTALSTYARGLQTVTDGVSAEDAELISQGQLVIADGERLAARARQALEVLGASCPGPG